MHHGPLIAILVAGLGLAFVFGALAQKLRISPLVGYLVAGVAVGPFTPGFVADQNLANELAEIGVILLMFGVGLHFSLKDLLSVKAIAVPGAIVQIGVATLLGMGLGLLMGWGWIAGLVFGLALSVASTVVLLRALQERRLVQSEKGKIAVGWLIVEDLAMVLALVMIPAVADALHGAQPGIPSPLSSQFDLGLWGVLGFTLMKVVAFIAFMLVVGRRVIPWILHWVAHTGSRELFRLAVLAVALGVAFLAASLFGVSFALGAFFAGVVMGESELSQRATEEALPLRDAFAVLFFVSVGMLFDPTVVIEQPWGVLATVAIIVVDETYDRFTDEVANQVTLRLRVLATALAVSGNAGDEMALKALTDSIPRRAQMLADSIHYAHGPAVVAQDADAVEISFDTTASAVALGQSLAVNISSHTTRPIMRFSGPPSSEGITNSPTQGMNTSMKPAMMPALDSGTVTSQKALNGEAPRS